MSARRVPALEEARDLLLALLLRMLPVDRVSDFGAWMGEREGRRAIAAKRLWVQRLRDNFARYDGVADAAEADRRVLAYTARVGRTYAEIPVMQRMVAEQRVEIVGREHLAGLSKPAILVGCHMSHWELLGLAATLLEGGITDLYVPPINAAHEREVMRARRQWAVDSELVPASPVAMLRLVRALERRRNLLLFVDEEKAGYVWGPSLGRTHPATGNLCFAARLSVRFGIDILPVHVESAGKARYRLVIEQALQPGSGDAVAATRALVARLDAIADAWIRARLEDWYWLSTFEYDKPPPGRGAAGGPEPAHAA